uniref:Uncharacterized protein n=1 Tax=Leersia perrieri TaxID=77586 RepID=A0A0D9WFV2_9ORYZ
MDNILLQCFEKKDNAQEDSSLPRAEGWECKWREGRRFKGKLGSLAQGKSDMAEINLGQGCSAL